SQVASQANLSLARDSQEAGHDAKALGQLTQALRFYPRNSGATAFASILLAQNNWALPVTGPMRHESAINCVQFSPDGHQLLTASNDNTARLWDTATGKPIGDLMTHQGWVYTAQFSPDGRRVVTASIDTTARLWDAAPGKPGAEPMKHQ